MAARREARVCASVRSSRPRETSRTRRLHAARRLPSPAPAPPPPAARWSGERRSGGPTAVVPHALGFPSGPYSRVAARVYSNAWSMHGLLLFVDVVQGYCKFACRLRYDRCVRYRTLRAQNTYRRWRGAWRRSFHRMNKESRRYSTSSPSKYRPSPPLSSFGLTWRSSSIGVRPPRAAACTPKAAPPRDGL